MSEISGVDMMHDRLPSDRHPHTLLPLSHIFNTRSTHISTCKASRITTFVCTHAHDSKMTCINRIKLIDLVLCMHIREQEIQTSGDVPRCQGHSIVNIFNLLDYFSSVLCKHTCAHSFSHLSFVRCFIFIFYVTFIVLSRS